MNDPKKKNREEGDYIKKMNPRFYGLISFLLGIGLGIVTVKYVQDDGFFDLSKGTLLGMFGVPIFIIGTFYLCVGGLYYLIKGKWIEE